MPDNSAIDTLKSLLGSDAEQKIQTVLGALSSSPQQETEQTSLSVPKQESESISLPQAEPVGVDSILKLKGIIDELSSQNNDSRSRLLLSLKPFMRSTRQQSIDSAIKLLNLSKLSSLFKL